MRIYEFGIVVEKGEPSDGLRVIATDEMPIYSRFSLTVVDHRGSSLNERLAKVLSPSHAYRNADYYEETDTRYALRACAYQVERIATYYADNTRLFEAHQRQQVASGGPRAIAGNTDDQRATSRSTRFLDRVDDSMNN